MTDINAELHERGVDAALDAVLRGTTREVFERMLSAYLALAPQAPASAVPGWSVTVHESDERTWLRLKSSQGQEAMLSCKTKHDNGETLGSQIVKAFAASFSSHPPPAQADDGKDAEIEHLKLEMDGVDNAKEEIGRLLGLTEEFRWKRISAAIYEQKSLIRELEQAVAFADDNRTFQIERAEKAEALIRELVTALEEINDNWRRLEPTHRRRLEIAIALAKAKALGYEL